MRVVPAFEQLEHRHIGLGLSLEPTPIEDFPLQGGKEALGHGIVVGITFRRMDGATFIARQYLPKVYDSLRSVLSDRHIQCRQADIPSGTPR